jgi:ADP-heptose:LPS heptosyltransferase
MSSPNKVLTINFGGIGDEVLFLPALATLKQLLPDSKITLLVEPRSKSVSEVTDLIDQVITFDIKKRPLTPMDLLQLTNLLRAGRYDIVVSSGSSPMVAMLLFLSGIPLRIGYDSGRPWNSLLTHPVKLVRDQYAADMYHDLTKGVANYLRRKYHPNGSIRVDETKSHVPVVTVKDQSLAQMKTVLEEGAEACWGDITSGGTGLNQQTKPIKYVLLHPGTSRMAISKGIVKTWSNENWLAYIDLLQNGSAQEPASARSFEVRIVLAGGPDDKEVIADLEAALKAKGIRYISAAGKTRGLADLAALTSLCHLLVCVDSAPMHIGVGLNKKMVALFGPTEPQKLIPDTPQFKVLADRPESPAPPRTLLDGLGVRLHPESVYQSSLDLLKAD